MKLVSGEPNGINQSKKNWTPPINWTGPCAVLYQSFDSSYGLVLMEGNQTTSDPVPLVSGKVKLLCFQENIQCETIKCNKTQTTLDCVPLVSGKVRHTRFVFRKKNSVKLKSKIK